MSVCSETLHGFLECLFQRAADMVALRIHLPISWVVIVMGSCCHLLQALAGSVEFLLSQFSLSRLSN